MRIVCLSAESADVCARLGAWDDVVAVSAFADQSGLARKPVVSGFSTGDAGRVVACEPDLVIAFSDVQADLAAALIRAGTTVLATNQRTLAEISGAIRLIARAIDRAEAGERLAAEFEQQLRGFHRSPVRRPRVYFEEWPEPPISAIGWVGELIELVGGTDIFAERRGRSSGERTVRDEEVLAAEPDYIFASWCGKPADIPGLQRRFADTPAARNGRIMELPASDFLQPGPRLCDGAHTLHRILGNFD